MSNEAFEKIALILLNNIDAKATQIMRNQATILSKFEILNDMPAEISESTRQLLAELEESIVAGWDASVNMLKQVTLDGFIIPRLGGD